MSSHFARLRGALDRVGTTTPGTIVGVFAEDLTAIMNHYVEVVREAAELKARAQPAPITSESGNQAAQGASAITSESVPLLSDTEVNAAIPHPTTFSQSEPAWNSSDMRILRTTARAIEQLVRAKMGVAMPSDVVCDKDPQGCWNVRCQLGKVCKNAATPGIVGKEGA